MEHHHDHSHKPLTNLNRAFIIGISLNLFYVIVQIVVGLHINSLSLLSDAGHNFLDVAGLALSLLAFKLTKIKANDRYTFGYRKSSILVSLLNAVVLLMSIGAIAYEAILRFKYPEPLPGKTIAIIAAIGIFINAGSAFLFFNDKDHDMNVKSAFLHLMSDALVSMGLVFGGIIMYYTGLYWIDPLLSIIICIVILASTWSLLKDSLKLSLDGVPEGIKMEEVTTKVKQIKGVLDFHHVHIWAISTTENALTGHLVVSSNTSNDTINTIKHELKHQLEHLEIHHVTIETEFDDKPCEQPNC